MLSLQRPLDDKSQLRIRLEAEAVLSVLDLVEAGTLRLVSSDVLAFETERNPNLTRMQFAEEVLKEAFSHVALSDSIEQ